MKKEVYICDNCEAQVTPLISRFATGTPGQWELWRAGLIEAKHDLHACSKTCAEAIDTKQKATA